MPATTWVLGVPLGVPVSGKPCQQPPRFSVCLSVCLSACQCPANNANNHLGSRCASRCASVRQTMPATTQVFGVPVSGKPCQKPPQFRCCSLSLYTVGHGRKERREAGKCLTVHTHKIVSLYTCFEGDRNTSFLLFCY